MACDILKPELPQDLTAVAMWVRELALAGELGVTKILATFDDWASALHGQGLDDIPGVAFLRLWLRRGTLEPLLDRELGLSLLNGGWQVSGLARLRTFPLGLVGHWPAANIEIQPILSLTCALLGGNSCLLRVPAALREVTHSILRKLQEVDSTGELAQRVLAVEFDHSRTDLQQAMAKAVDGAMVWGGPEAVAELRALPFSPRTRIAVFGPRLSVAAMDAACWCDGTARDSWCRRLARDVWQFDQLACSSPQTLFLERCPGSDPMSFIAGLQRAFEEENRLHPRQNIEPALTSIICQARSSWLLDDTAHRAVFPTSPDWTILLGEGSEIPTPTQGRTLCVLMVESLFEAVARFDGSVQTLGVAVANKETEEALAVAAGRRGVDRIVKLGRMHIFGSPWDGADLIRPMVRLVRHVPSHE